MHLQPIFHRGFVMRNAVIGLLIGFTLLNAPLRAEISIASLTPNEVSIALAAIEAAKKIVEAGRGSLLMAGSVLSTDDVPSGNVLTILDYPNLAKLTPGSILLLAKNNCEPIENCLVARRVIGRDSSGRLQTERYGSAEPFLLDPVEATLLGSVVYAVDLQTGGIRDMRPGRKSVFLSVAEAIALESKR
jgi:hypothetical protein